MILKHIELSGFRGVKIKKIK